MNPRLYAKLLHEILEDKSDNEQEKIIKRFNVFLIRSKISHLKNVVLKELGKIERESLETRTAYVCSPVELTSEMKRSFESIFTGPKEFLINQKLLAGIAVRQKDTLYNSTLKKRVEILKSLQ